MKMFAIVINHMVFFMQDFFKTMSRLFCMTHTTFYIELT